MSIIVEFDDSTEFVYLPSVRMLRVINNSTWIEEKIRKEYFDENDKRFPVIETGETFYNELRSRYTRDIVDIENHMEFQDFLSKNFFNGQDVKMTSNVDMFSVKFRIGNEEERFVRDLGEGLQMIVLIFFQLFRYEKVVLCIEELEMYLHPGFVRQLVRLLALPRFSNHKIFATTHSNHALEAALEVGGASVYSVRRVFEEGIYKSKVSLCAYGNSTILKDLGVVNSSVFLSNCTIWVEGITDSLYIRKYIKLELVNNSEYSRIKDRVFENLHYSFAFSGGSSIIHFDFESSGILESEKIVARNLCGKALVVVDSDKSSAKEAQRQKVKDQLGADFYPLDVLEIENLLSPELLKVVVQEWPTWTDEDLSRIDLNFEEYKLQKLGTYLDNALESKFPGHKKKHFATSASEAPIADKAAFATHALKHMTYELMTESAKVLARRVLEHILKHNDGLRQSM